MRRLNQLRIDLKASNPQSFFGACQIEVRDPEHEEIEYIKTSARMGYAGQFFALDLISSDFDYDNLLTSVSTSDGSPLSDEDRHSVAQHGLCYEILDNLRAILSLWNICYLGCLSAPYILSKFGNSVLEAGEMCESRCLSALNEGQWFSEFPQSYPDPLEVIEWSANCSGYWSGDASTNLQKATACLTRTFSSRFNSTGAYSTLLWSLAGLEALVCDSQSSIGYQMRKRIPLIVGAFPFVDLNRAISRRYDFRSRLFHGDVKIRSPFADDDDQYGDDKHHEVQADTYADFFCLLLTCCIRAGITAKTQEITFSEQSSIAF